MRTETGSAARQAYRASRHTPTAAVRRPVRPCSRTSRRAGRGTLRCRGAWSGSRGAPPPRSRSTLRPVASADDDDHGDGRGGRVAPAARAARRRPDMSGRWRSSRTRSGRCSRGQLEAEAPLHAPRSARCSGRRREDPLDQPEVGQVVLDVEHGRRVGRRRAAGVGRRASAVVAGATLGASATRQLDPERRAHADGRCSTLDRRRPSPRPGRLRQGQADAGALDAGCSAPSRSNGVNSRSRCSGADARAGVGHLIRSTPVVPPAAVDSTVPPSRLYLTAFDRRLSSTCLQPLAVGSTCASRGAGRRRSARSPRLGRQRAHRGRGTRRATSSTADRLERERQLARPRSG